MERRLDLIHFTRKYVVVVNEENANHRKLDKSLQASFNTAEYGAAFLGYLIDTFNERQFEFETPKSITDASLDYIKQNNVLVEFIEEAFEITNDPNDMVFLIDAYELCKSLNYAAMLGVKSSGALSQRMKMKNIPCQYEPGSKRLRFTHLKIQDKHNVQEQAPRARDPTRYSHAANAPGPSNGALMTTARPPWETERDHAPIAE